MKKKEIYYHVAGWSLYIIYLIIGFLMMSSGKKVSPYNYTILFPKVVEFYICYLWVYPRFLYKNNLKLAGGILIAIISFIAIRFLLEEVAMWHLFGLYNYFEYTFISYTLDNVYWGTSAVMLSAAIYSGFSAIYKEQENKSLREEKIQAELAFLKTQINPHFLYNTLNYIYSLAYPVSEKLGDAVIKLSQLMRYMLTESASGDVDLQKEVDYITNYISIYQLRFEDTFFVDFKTEGDIAGKRVAALLLVPFVENAFKHGVVNDADRPIRIRLKVAGNRLTFTVSNQISRGQKDHSTGVGLPNIRRRMELIYPNRHELLIADNGNTYKATLNITITTN
jgi:two-component system LytT family sensor kinase